MGNVMVATGVMLGLGLFFGTVLALAYRFLKVEEDPRIEAVESMLPGSNCGACGEPGCRGLAEKIVDSTVAPSKCTVSSPDGIDLISYFFGVTPLKYRHQISDGRQQTADGRRQTCLGSLPLPTR